MSPVVSNDPYYRGLLHFSKELDGIKRARLNRACLQVARLEEARVLFLRAAGGREGVRERGRGGGGEGGREGGREEGREGE